MADKVNVRRAQKDALPVTTSVMVTESGRVILGLKGLNIFLVFIAFTATQMITEIFPLALFVACAMFTFIKFYIDAKPNHFILHILMYLFTNPKHLRHRSHDKKDLFAE